MSTITVSTRPIPRAEADLASLRTAKTTSPPFSLGGLSIRKPARRQAVTPTAEPRSADAAVLPAEGNRYQGCGLCRRRFGLGLQRPDGLERDRRKTGCRPRQPIQYPFFGRRRLHLGFAARPAAFRSGVSAQEIL